MSRDDFTKHTIDTLAKRVSNHCSNPACRKPTTGPHTTEVKAVNIGVAAHITAAAPRGPRFDESLTAVQRKSISNGIWLCQVCAKLVDNDPARYTIGLLRSWKDEAEATALRELESRGGLAKGQQARTSFDFDAALSFAPEDQKHAHAIAAQLKQEGLRVFDDGDHLAWRWGKSAEQLHDAYGPRSQYMIPLVSKHYLQNSQSYFAFGIAKCEERTRGVEFILPVRIDDSVIPGLNDGRECLSLDEHSVEQIVAIFNEKRGHTPQSSSQSSKHSIQKAHILERTSRRALGLIATAAMPLPLDAYSRLFPEINWQTVIDTLEGYGFAKRRGTLVHAAEEAEATIAGDSEESEELEEAWLGALEPLRLYKDIAPYLAMHYFRAERFDDAISLLASIAAAVELGPWNGAYISVFKAFRERKFQNKLQNTVRLEMLNSLGICLTRDSQYEAALDCYNRLRLNAKAIRDDHWIGQSYLNAGVTSWIGGSKRQAVAWYKKAKRHGNNTGDQLLEARALGNLAEATRESCPDASRKLLLESLAIKQKVGDAEGLLVGAMQLGHLEATCGRLEKAISFYEEALSMSRELESPYKEVAALHNLGNAYRECGRRSKAIHYFGRAYELASELEDEEAQILSSVGQGAVLFDLDRFQEAEAAYRNLLSHAENADDLEHCVCALHGIGVMLMVQGQLSDGRRMLKQALQAARSMDSAHWIARCLVDKCRPLVGKALGSPTDEDLLITVKCEENSGKDLVAIELWVSIAHFRINAGAGVELIGKAYRSARSIIERLPKTPEDLWWVMVEIHGWFWSVREYEASLATLEESERIAAACGVVDKQIRSIDQRAMHLQELGRFQEALLEHRKSARLAETNGNLVLWETTLNNLGEALRNTGRLKEAITVFEKAEAIAKERADEESAIGIAHNRALVHQKMDDLTEATRLLNQCRNRARHLKLWEEYVRAWEGLANLACYETKISLAKSRYERTIAEARKNKLYDQLPRIALNYSRFLHWLDEPKKGLRILKQQELRFKDRVDAHEYYITLGQLSDEVGELDNAVQYFTRGRSIVEAFGDEEAVADFSSLLAEIYEQQNAFDKSAAEIRSILKCITDANQRAELLIQLLRIELAANHDKQAEKVFEEARRIVEINKLELHSVDLYMAVVDHDWKGNREAKLNSLKAFTLAMYSGMKVDVSVDDSEESVSGDVGGHMIQMLTCPKLAPNALEVDSLIADLEAWLCEQLEDDRDMLRALTWPLYMARKLLPFIGSPKRMANEVERLVEAGEAALFKH